MLFIRTKMYYIEDEHYVTVYNNTIRNCDTQTNGYK